MTDTHAAAQIAHVLFVDIIGYSRTSLDEQGRLLAQLNRVVGAVPAFTEALPQKKVRPIPTGDGMALIFFEDVTAPARCAAEIARAIPRSERGAGIAVRMGLHSGLVQRQMDIAGGENLVGEGLNTAQRIMDFGDAGHILMSSQYATWLQQFDHWAPFVMHLGEGVAKHGIRLLVFSLRSYDFGRADIPQRLTASIPSEAPALSPDPPGTPRRRKGDLPAVQVIAPPAGVPAATNGTAPNGSVAVEFGSGERHPPRIVLLCKRNVQPDENVLTFVEERLRTEGFDVFVDRHHKIGIEWARESEQRVRDADAVVAIVSPKSLQSEMLEYEMELAHDQAMRTSKPLILPVSIGLESTVEGSVAAIIAPLHQFHWHGPEDDNLLLAELTSAIREPLKSPKTEIKLEPVGGAVPPDSPFYVERACDPELAAALEARETILLIKGPRQVGKTSLQARGARQARASGWRVGVTDFQKLNTAQMTTDDTFYRLLCATLARQMKFSYDFSAEWDDLFGANMNMENFLRALLESSDEPLVWCMDEVDKLFSAPFASDFFGLVRSWHNSRSTEPGGPWDKLTVIIAYATEAHLFIQDLNQSPFNVGRRLDLEDFNLQQTVDLNGRYGGPLSSYAEAEALHALIGGQPYLTRGALDALAIGKVGFSSLLSEAERDDGPFSEHLKRIFVSVSRLPAVVSFARAVLAGTATPTLDQESYYRLLAAGIIKQDRHGAIRFRCDLYRRYLLVHLG